MFLRMISIVPLLTEDLDSHSQGKCSFPILALSLLCEIQCSRLPQLSRGLRRNNASNVMQRPKRAAADRSSFCFHVARSSGINLTQRLSVSSICCTECLRIRSRCYAAYTLDLARETWSCGRLASRPGTCLSLCAVRIHKADTMTLLIVFIAVS